MSLHYKKQSNKQTNKTPPPNTKKLPQTKQVLKGKKKGKMLQPCNEGEQKSEVSKRHLNVQEAFSKMPLSRHYLPTCANFASHLYRPASILSAFLFLLHTCSPNSCHQTELIRTEIKKNSTATNKNKYLLLFSLVCTSLIFRLVGKGLQEISKGLCRTQSSFQPHQQPLLQG